MNRLLKTLSPLALLVAVLTARNVSAQQPVNVVFSNQTDRPAQVLWVNGAQKQKYLDLQPGESQTLQSYVGHAWTIVGAEGSVGRVVTRANDVIMLGDFRPAPSVPEVGPRPAPAPPVPADEPQSRPMFPQKTPPPQSLSINEELVTFAASMIGQRVGAGQSAELVVAAMRAAGSRPNQGYVWGAAVRGPEALLPGDIVQMYDARFETADGRRFKAPGTHTAIVVGVEGAVINVLEQNLNGGPVREGSYDLGQMTAGRMEFYRPIAGGKIVIGKPWRN